MASSNTIFGLTNIFLCITLNLLCYTILYHTIPYPTLNLYHHLIVSSTSTLPLYKKTTTIFYLFLQYLCNGSGYQCHKKLHFTANNSIKNLLIITNPIYVKIPDGLYVRLSHTYNIIFLNIFKAIQVPCIFPDFPVRALLSIGVIYNTQVHCPP